MIKQFLIRVLVVIGFQFLGLNSFAQDIEYKKSYYNNGVLKSEGWIENNLKKGYWKFYYSNGNKEKEGRFKKGLENKYWFYFKDNKNKLKEGHFVSGQKNDWWIIYATSNSIDEKIQYKNNKKNGYCLCYKKNKLVKIERFTNDIKEGEWTDLKKFKKENKF